MSFDTIDLFADEPSTKTAPKCEVKTAPFTEPVKTAPFPDDFGAVSDEQYEASISNAIEAERLRQRDFGGEVPFFLRGSYDEAAQRAAARERLGL